MVAAGCACTYRYGGVAIRPQMFPEWMIDLLRVYMPLCGLHNEGHDRVLTFDLDPQWMKYVLHKGYIGVDGASITVSSVDRAANTFSISLIPETIERTTLGRILLGDRVNIEVDSQTQTIVETIERVMQDPQMRESMTQQAGFG